MVAPRFDAQCPRPCGRFGLIQKGKGYGNSHKEGRSYFIDHTGHGANGVVHRVIGKWSGEERRFIATLAPEAKVPTFAERFGGGD